MAEQARGAVDDGQAQAGAALLAAAIETAELLEDFQALVLGDARTAVPHFDAQRSPSAAAAEQHAAATGVAHCVGQEVLQDAAQQGLVAAHHGGGVDAAQLQALGLRQDAELARQRLEQRPQRQVAHLGADGAGLQARDVEQAGQDRVLRFQRVLDVAHQFRRPAAVHALAERVDEHARRVERLLQVVHGGGDEAGLGTVGALGLALGLLQLAGALLDAPLQGGGERAQVARRALVGGDVGIAGDKAAAGQRVAADLQHGAVGPLALELIGLRRLQVFEAATDRLLDAAAAKQAAARVVAQDVLDRPAGAHQLRRHPEQLDVAPIPGHQAQLRVDHADALRQVLQALAIAQRGALRRLHQAVLRGTQGGGVLLDHLLQLLAAAPAQARHAPALLQEQQQEHQAEAGAGGGEGGDTAGGGAVAAVAQQVQGPAFAGQRQGLPQVGARAFGRRHFDHAAAVVQLLHQAAAQRLQRAIRILLGMLDLAQPRGVHRLQFAEAPAGTAGEEDDAVGIAEQDQVRPLAPLLLQRQQLELDHQGAEQAALLVAHRLGQEVAGHAGGDADAEEAAVVLRREPAEIRAEAVVVADVAVRPAPVAGGDGVAAPVEQGQGGGGGGAVDALQLEVELRLPRRVEPALQRSAQFRVQRQHRRQGAVVLDQGLQGIGIEAQLLPRLLALLAQGLLLRVPAGAVGRQRGGGGDGKGEQDGAELAGG